MPVGSGSSVEATVILHGSNESSPSSPRALRVPGGGLITWSATPQVLELALSYEPDAFFLSFGASHPRV